MSSTAQDQRKHVRRPAPQVDIRDLTLEGVALADADAIVVRGLALGHAEVETFAGLLHQQTGKLIIVMDDDEVTLETLDADAMRAAGWVRAETEGA